MNCGGMARTITPAATIRAYVVVEIDEKPEGGVRPRMIAEMAARMPIVGDEVDRRDADRAGPVGLGAAQLHDGREHEHVHAHVEDHRHVLQHREGRRGVGRDHEHQRQHRHDRALQEQDRASGRRSCWSSAAPSGR